MLGATRHGSVIRGDARARRGPGDRCSGARGQCRPTVRPTARPHPSCLSPSSAGPRAAGQQGHAVLTYRGVGLFILMHLKQVEGAAGEATAQPARPRRLLPPADPRPAREPPPPLPVGSGTCTAPARDAATLHGLVRLVTARCRTRRVARQSMTQPTAPVLAGERGAGRAPRGAPAPRPATPTRPQRLHGRAGDDVRSRERVP